MTHDQGRKATRHAGITQLPVVAIYSCDLLWLKLLTSVRECDIDYMRHISEIMEEYCMDAMGRSAMETHLRMTHKRVNDERSARSRQVSAHERYLKMFFDRQAVRRGAEHAPAMEARL